MIVDVECERCRGEGWLLTREPRLGSGLYETTCPKCEGHGAWTFYMARMCDMHIVAWLEHHLKEINN